MRALIAALLVLAAPAAAGGRPLEPDRHFGRDGVLRLDEPTSSKAVVALRDGGTLHATSAGLLRVSRRGEPLGGAPLDPPGVPADMVAAPGGAAVLGSEPFHGYGQRRRHGLWLVGHDGAPRHHGWFEVPGAQTAWPLRVVRRGRGYAVLVQLARPGEDEVEHAVLALDARGALDRSWGHGGMRRLPGDGASIGAARGGRLIAATASGRCSYRRRVPVILRVQRLDRSGAQLRSRRVRVADRTHCPATEPGDVHVDGRGRTLVAGIFGGAVSLLRLRRDLARDRRFGRRGLVEVDTRHSWLPPSVQRLPGGYALALTRGDPAPRGEVGILNARGRRLRTRRLRVTRSYPSSAVHDIALDRRGGLVAAGSLHDTDLFIREDYGQPHLAIWRVRTR